MRSKLTIGSACLFILLLCACNKNSGKNLKTITLMGGASIKMGATGNASLHITTPITQPPSVMSAANTNGEVTPTFAPPADGNWNLTPKKAKITFTRIDLINSAGGAVSGTLNNCQITYDLSNNSGTELGDCDFTLSLTTEDGSTPTFAGEYIGVYIYYSRTIPVLIEDSQANFYSDSSSATLLSVSPSATTDDYVNYTVGGGSSSQDLAVQAYFASPFNLEDGAIPQLQIVTDMIHTIMAKVEDGTPSFQDNTGQRPVALMAAPSGMTVKNEFYSTATTLNATSMAGSGETFVRLFYADDIPVVAETNGYIQNCTTGFAVSQAFAVNPANSPLQNTDGDRAGGFLGLNSGFIYWALATTQRWTTYEALFKLERKTTLGADASLQCQTTATVPTPSENTYSDDPPSLNPTLTMNLKLLAQ